jgi:hypothetical protein
MENNMANPSKTNVILKEEVQSKDGTTVSVLLEQNIYDDAPYMTYDAKVSSAGLPHQPVFQTFTYPLARVFYRDYIKLLKGE